MIVFVAVSVHPSLFVPVAVYVVVVVGLTLIVAVFCPLLQV